ncbi:MAG: nucleotidyltransferase family protein [Gemmatimonadaceae bacterium]|nr:nucleotidyltransferase family protein [Gemmatimonadaceae bacterium]
MIAGVLLAAGSSSRFGAQKLVAPLRGRAVIEWSLGTLASAVDECWVVVPSLDDAVAVVVRRAEGRAHIVANVDRHGGIASSIVAGVSALPADCDAAVIALGDEPLIAAAVVMTMVRRFVADDHDAVMPNYRDGPGRPVLFSRALFPALVSLRGDRGAADLLRAVGPRVCRVDVDVPGPRDVDTVDALGALDAMTWC